MYKLFIRIFLIGLIIGLAESIGISIGHPLYISLGKTAVYILIPAVANGIVFLLWTSLFLLLRKLRKSDDGIILLSSLLSYVVFIYGTYRYLFYYFGANPLLDNKVYLYFAVSIFICILIGYIIMLIARNMKTSKILYIIIAIVSLFHLIYPYLKSPSSKKSPLPITILITLDTYRADHLSINGKGICRTPYMSEFSKDAVVFNKCYTPVPFTTPAHASMFCGLMPVNHGSRFNAIPIEKGIVTIPEIFHGKGSLTSAFVSAYPVAERSIGMSDFFDIYDDSQVHYKLFANLRRNCLIYDLACLYRLKTGQSEGMPTIEKARGWLTRYHDSSFFLWIHLYDPHTPYEYHKGYSEEYTKDLKPSMKKFNLFTIYLINSGQLKPTKDDLEYLKGLYAGECSYTDYLVSLFIEDLKKYKIYDEALIIIAGDHGESLVEHNYYFSHGVHLYEPSIKVPLIIKFPQNKYKGKEINNLVSLVDIFPTILDCINAPGNSKTDGISLIPVIKNDKITERKLYLESGSNTMVGHEGVQIEDEFKNKKYALLLESGLKLISFPDGKIEGYDLNNDPKELNPLAEYPDSIKKDLIEFKSKPHKFSGAKYLDKEKIRQLKALGYIN